MKKWFFHIVLVVFCCSNLAADAMHYWLFHETIATESNSSSGHEEDNCLLCHLTWQDADLQGQNLSSQYRESQIWTFAQLHEQALIVHQNSPSPVRGPPPVRIA